MIDRFGVAAVLGDRVLRTGEMLRMLRAESVVKAYQERERSNNWAEWAKSNEGANKTLIEAMKAADNGSE